MLGRPGRIVGGTEVDACGDKALTDSPSRLVLADAGEERHLDAEARQVHRFAGSGTADRLVVPARMDRGAPAVGQPVHMDHPIPCRAAEDRYPHQVADTGTRADVCAGRDRSREPPTAIARPSATIITAPNA